MVECSGNLPAYEQAQAMLPSCRSAGIVQADPYARKDLLEFRPHATPSSDRLQLPVLRKDAVLVVVQIKASRSCRLWIDGGKTPVELKLDLTLQIPELQGLATSPSPAADQWLHFHVAKKRPPALDEEEFQPAGSLPYPPSMRISDTFAHRLGECLIEAIQAVRVGGDPLLESFLATLMECLLLSLRVPMVQPCQTASPIGSIRGGLASWQVRRAEQLMSENLDRVIPLPEVAAACRLSPGHFSRAFKVTVGQSPHRWLLEYRVERAKRLIIESDHSLAEVALLCGFADQSHFARTFRRLAGSTPGAWRRAQACMFSTRVGQIAPKKLDFRNTTHLSH